ncbi:MAG: tetratricopeptide repeat protein, partial [Pirellula sp.]|nr:tetratricopeptide repeat protein [Pirellula sp.]
MNVRFTLILAFWFGLSFPFATPTLGQDASQSEEDSKRSLERFESVLLRSPKQGIALDKVYEAHVQRGDLDDYLTLLESSAEKDGFDTAKVFVVIGLLESKRSRDLPAIGWLRKAEELAPKEPMLSFYRAQSEVFAGKTSDAIESFERALRKNPTKVERLQIEESLGRLYLRTQQRDKAAEVWTRLENAFPKDLLVSERIAQINQTEGNLP